MSRTITRVHVAAINPRASAGVLIAGTLRIACALGRSGIGALKREGDGKTPRARLRLEKLLFRADRLARLPTVLPLAAIRQGDAWCDAPADPNYNRPVHLPFGSSHEGLRRADGLYDIVGVLDWNRHPRKRFGGSAIFFHLMRPDGGPTAGCIAVSLKDMRRLLPRLGRGTVFRTF